MYELVFKSQKKTLHSHRRENLKFYIHILNKIEISNYAPRAASIYKNILEGKMLKMGKNLSDNCFPNSFYAIFKVETKW
jgi:hypothetical protein